jgi:tRNA threonylcarbamoyladenosine biosynthesis protein TsaB
VKVLAIDTSTPRESVALVDGGTIRGEVRLLAEDAHSRRLLPAVAALLEGLSLRPADVEGFAAAVGPGSFTGLRVGVSTIQGLALAAGRPCYGVCTLDALAARIRGAAERLVAVMDAYRDEVFAAVYDREGNRLGDPLRRRPERLVHELPEGAAFIGDGASRYRALILEARPRAVFPERSLFLAGTVGLLAEPRLREGSGVPPAALRPLYLREADIRPPRA